MQAEPSQKQGAEFGKQDSHPAGYPKTQPPRSRSPLPSFKPGNNPWDDIPFPELPARRLVPHSHPPRRPHSVTPALQLDDGGQILVETGVQKSNLSSGTSLPISPPDARRSQPDFLADLIGQPLSLPVRSSQWTDQVYDTPPNLAKIKTDATELSGVSGSPPDGPSVRSAQKTNTNKADSHGRASGTGIGFGSQIGMILRDRSKEPAGAGASPAGTPGVFSRRQLGFSVLSHQNSSTITTKNFGNPEPPSPAQPRRSRVGRWLADLPTDPRNPLRRAAGALDYEDIISTPLRDCPFRSTGVPNFGLESPQGPNSDNKGAPSSPRNFSNTLSPDPTDSYSFQATDDQKSALELTRKVNSSQGTPGKGSNQGLEAFSKEELPSATVECNESLKLRKEAISNPDLAAKICIGRRRVVEAAKKVDFHGASPCPRLKTMTHQLTALDVGKKATSSQDFPAKEGSENVKVVRKLENGDTRPGPSDYQGTREQENGALHFWPYCVCHWMSRGLAIWEPGLGFVLSIGRFWQQTIAVRLFKINCKFSQVLCPKCMQY